MGTIDKRETFSDIRKAFKMVLEDGPGQSHVRKELTGIGLHTATMLMRHGGWNLCEQFAACSQITGNLWASRWDDEILRKMD